MCLRDDPGQVTVLSIDDLDAAVIGNRRNYAVAGRKKSKNNKAEHKQPHSDKYVADRLSAHV